MVLATDVTFCEPIPPNHQPASEQNQGYLGAMSAWRWSTCRHVSVGDLLAYHLPTDKSHILPGYIGYMCLCGLMLLWYIPKFVPIIYIYIMYIYIYDHMHIFIYIYIYILSGCPISWSIHVYLYTYNTLVLSFSLLIFNCLLGQLPSSWETLAEGCSHATWKGPVAPPCNVLCIPVTCVQ